MLDRLRQLAATQPDGYDDPNGTNIFVRSLIHKMNNMLTIFRGYSSMLNLEDGLTSSAKETVTEMINHSDFGAALLNRAAQCVRPVTPHLAELEVAELFTQLHSSLATTVGNLDQIEIRHSVPVTIHTDARLLKLMLLEIVGNAIHATRQRGQILVEDQPHSDGNNQYHIISVYDTGTGIADNYIKKVWEPFYSFDQSEQRQGLGLPLVLHYANACGILPAIASQSGLGTRLDLSIPVGQA